MKIFIDYSPPNWNEYINMERTNLYAANNLKQQEKQIVALFARGKKYEGSYPVEITFKPHFKDKRRDLDNTRLKGILDGLVSCGVIKNDNLNHIQKIIIEPVFSTKKGIEIEINSLNLQT
jgi:Holliday junction resolvase RusA-like endonuclease